MTPAGHLGRLKPLPRDAEQMPPRRMKRKGRTSQTSSHGALPWSCALLWLQASAPWGHDASRRPPCTGQCQEAMETRAA